MLLGAAALAADPGGWTVGALAGLCAVKAAVDGACGRALRPGGFTAGQLALVPLKDLVFAAAWARGLVRSTVEWRGHRLRVLPGTRIDPAALRPPGGRLARATR